MKKFLLCILSFIIFSYSHSSEIIELAGEVRIPLPENWQASGNNGTYPFQIIDSDQSAEILMYKSIISKDEIVHNNKELKESVNIIISDIILTLPEAKLLTNIGKIDDNRAIFSVEFVSVDTVTFGQIFHRLNCYLYAHPNGEQLLFTLWGKTGSDTKEILDNEILFMQNNFSYFGESDNRLFQAEQVTDWKIYILILFIIVSVLLIFKKYKFTNSIIFSEDSHFWRCHCGRQNHDSHDSCKRCGQTRKTKESV